MRENFTLLFISIKETITIIIAIADFYSFYNCDFTHIFLGCTYFQGKEDCCHNLTVVYKGESKYFNIQTQIFYFIINYYFMNTLNCFYQISTGFF